MKLTVLHTTNMHGGKRLLRKSFKGNPTLAWWHIKCAHFCSYRFHVDVQSKFIQKIFFFFFCFQYEFLWVQPYWFALYQWRAEKAWLVTYLTLFPHTPALFLTSLVHTVAWTQIDSANSRILTIFKPRILTKEVRHRMKPAVWLRFIPFLSIVSVMSFASGCL